MPDLPRQIRLAAGDYFMHGQDRGMRRVGLPGNVCRIALRLEGGLNAHLLRERAKSSTMLNWLARVRITRPVPVFPPVWRTVATPRAVLHEHNGQKLNRAGPDQLPRAVLERDLHAGRGPALALDLVSRGDESWDLVVSWNHALMDVRGAELVLRHLNSEQAVEDSSADAEWISPDQKRSSMSRWWRNVKCARSSIEWLRTSGREPLFSLLPTGRPTGPCRGDSRMISFSREDTDRIQARCERLNAGFRRSHFYLAALLRAVHTVASARGNKEGAYLVPVPHDLRKRGSSGPIFSNHLSILFYRIEPHQAVCLSKIIDELSLQMADQIRTRFPECCMAALEMFKPLPLDYYLHHLGGPTRGKFATLCFSDSGETCSGMSDLLGGRIQAVTHFVPTWRPPGLTVLFWSFAGQLRVLLAWVDDCLGPGEVNTLEQGLRTGLLEEEIP